MLDHIDDFHTVAPSLRHFSYPPLLSRGSQAHDRIHMLPKINFCFAHATFTGEQPCYELASQGGSQSKREHWERANSHAKRSRISLRFVGRLDPSFWRNLSVESRKTGSSRWDREDRFRTNFKQ